MRQSPPGLCSSTVTTPSSKRVTRAQALSEPRSGKTNGCRQTRASVNTNANTATATPTPKRARASRIADDSESENENENDTENRVLAHAEKRVRTESQSNKLINTRLSESPVDARPFTQLTPLAAIADAKAAFKPGSAPGTLVGRDIERTFIKTFLDEKAAGGRSLYVSGVPGTGKSAMIDEILQDFVTQSSENVLMDYQVGKINCMQFTDPQAIYKKIMSEFDVEEGAFGTSTKEPYRTLERVFGYLDGGDKLGVTPSINTGTKSKTQVVERKTIHILVLDEIDQLATRDNSVLYRIFEWPTLPGSTLLLIGIANALDLMQRYLPRLIGMKGGPRLLNFNPYTPHEISAIIKSRLLRLQHSTHQTLQAQTYTTVTTPAPATLVSFMQPSAIELCARKASGTGDLRRALDLVRVSFETLDLELRRKKDGSETALLERVEDVPRVGVPQVLKAAQGASGPGPTATVRNLATQQKAVLVALLYLIGSQCKSKTKEMVLGGLHEAYVGCLQRGAGRSLRPVTKTEFGDIISVFESVGIVSLGRAKEERLRRVSLECLPGQVEEGMKQDPLLWELWQELVAPLM